MEILLKLKRPYYTNRIQSLVSTVQNVRRHGLKPQHDEAEFPEGLMHTTCLLFPKRLFQFIIRVCAGDSVE